MISCKTSYTVHFQANSHALKHLKWLCVCGGGGGRVELGVYFVNINQFFFVAFHTRKLSFQR